MSNDALFRCTFTEHLLGKKHIVPPAKNTHGHIPIKSWSKPIFYEIML